MNEAKKIVKLMVESENLFSKLYLKYSQLFDNKKFWTTLAQEEVEHGQWLKALSDSRDIESIDTQTSSPAFISTMNLAMKEQIESNKEISLQEALTKALHLENTFLENNYFEIFKGQAASFQNVIERLAFETRKHRDGIERELAKYEIK